MPDLTTPLFVAMGFVGVGWLITRAGPGDADAIRHTLLVFALALGLLALGGTMGKLRATLGLGRMTHRVEARSQVDQAEAVRPTRNGGIRANPSNASAGSWAAPVKARPANATNL